MRCFVYKCLRRADTYVYLAERDGFDKIPAPLRDRLGSLSLVLEFELAAGRTLARQDPEVVRANLAEHGVHIQFPPPPLERLDRRD